MKKRLCFTECEHDGDLEVYESDLRKCGANIVSSSIDIEAEECDILIEIDDWDTFKAKFELTDTYNFWFI